MTFAYTKKHVTYKQVDFCKKNYVEDPITVQEMHEFEK